MIPFVGLAADVEVPTVLVAGWMMESSPSPAFQPLPMPLALQSDAFAAPKQVLPMTMHMRMWKWPPMVGPINRAGTFPGMTSTPEEIPQIDSGLPSIVMTKWPRGDDPISSSPAWATQPARKVPIAEQEGFGMRNVWTREHPTLPMWNPKPIGGMADGSNVRFVIRGTTKDGTGAALGGCTVYAMRVPEMGQPLDPDGVLVDIETSDAGGAYSSQVPQNVAHLLVGYKAGSPDVAGATVNTVMPEHM